MTPAVVFALDMWVMSHTWFTISWLIPLEYVYKHIYIYISWLNCPVLYIYVYIYMYKTGQFNCLLNYIPYINQVRQFSLIIYCYLISYAIDRVIFEEKKSWLPYFTKLLIDEFALVIAFKFTKTWYN